MTAFAVWFSRPNDTIPDQPPIDPVKLGPFDEFVQLTYSEMRAGPNGDRIAWMDCDSVWRVEGDRSATDHDYWYSDIVINEEV